MSAPSSTSEAAVSAFIARWSDVGAAERANYALLLTELCALLDGPPPDPANDDSAHNAYGFKRAVPLHQRDGGETVRKLGCMRSSAVELSGNREVFAEGDPCLLMVAQEPDD